jgi:hypothetical protein
VPEATAFPPSVVADTIMRTIELGVTITGTAVNEWLDDEGNPKFGKDEGDEGEKPPDKAQDEAEDKSQDESANA